ncbi:MAG: CAP domain-containing protein [Myxococcales bacterium]
MFAPLVLALAPVTAWASDFHSPFVLAPASLAPTEAAFVARCGPVDGALTQVARRAAEERAHGTPMDSARLGHELRLRGAPYVWPRLWMITGHGLGDAPSLDALAPWRASLHPLGERRCGAGIAQDANGLEVVAVVMVDVLADLAPLPTRVRAGQWLTVDATLRRTAEDARVFVAGANGIPRSVPTSRRGSHVIARFAPDRPGRFTVQVMVDGDRGPRPVLEALVFAEVEPADEAPGVPGEDTQPVGPADQALERNVAGLRHAFALPPLVRDVRLDALARAHAAAMAKAQTAAHDLGAGDPIERLRDAGLTARDAGENVASARTALEAHRALYASPSHRANLLRPEFRRVGFGVERDARGMLWVAELFASGLR